MNKKMRKQIDMKLIKLLNSLAEEELKPIELKPYDKIICPECGGESIAIFSGCVDEKNKSIFYSQCCMATI